MKTAVRRILSVAAAIVIAGSMVAPGLAVEPDEWQLAAGSEHIAVPISAPYSGLSLLRAENGRLDMWYPSAWRLVDLSSAGGSKLILTPDAQGWQTSFVITSIQTGKEASALDYGDMMAGFTTLVNALPGSQTVWQARWVQPKLFAFEARHTFDDGDTEAQRWVRQIYTGDRQFLLVAQAPSSAEYDRYAFDFVTMMLTFRWS